MVGGRKREGEGDREGGRKREGEGERGREGEGRSVKRGEFRERGNKIHMKLADLATSRQHMFPECNLTLQYTPALGNQRHEYRLTET